MLRRSGICNVWKHEDQQQLAILSAKQTNYFQAKGGAESRLTWIRFAKMRSRCAINETCWAESMQVKSYVSRSMRFTEKHEHDPNVQMTKRKVKDFRFRFCAFSGYWCVFISTSQVKRETSRDVSLCIRHAHMQAWKEVMWDGPLLCVPLSFSITVYHGTRSED